MDRKKAGSELSENERTSLASDKVVKHCISTDIKPTWGVLIGRFIQKGDSVFQSVCV